MSALQLSIRHESGRHSPRRVRKRLSTSAHYGIDFEAHEENLKMADTLSAEELMQRHEQSGKYISINGIRTFYIDSGEGPAVFCIHGVPTSSYLWRKTIPELNARGLRAIAIDLPGLGLSDRPENFEYSFSSFGRFCNHFLDALDVAEVHLVIHDIGTPVGLFMASQNNGRIRSLTVLNSMLDLEHFVKPLPMRPFEIPVLGETELALFAPLTFPLFMNSAGLENADAMTHNEKSVYIHFLKREDNGKAFLRIMRHFEKTAGFTQLCREAFENTSYPAQLIWGDKDPLLPFDEKAAEFIAARKDLAVTKVKAKHFLPEEAFETIGKKVAEIVGIAAKKKAALS